MTQDERWQKRYEEVVGFIEANHRNPSKYVTCSFLWHKERSFIPYFLWRKERSKETSTYPKSFPIWKDLTEEWQRPLILRLFWYRGTRDELFIGCAMRDDAGHAMSF
jgi:hypothetical protein